MKHREGVVVGIGRTAFSRDSGQTPLAMGAEAARAALQDAGIAPAEVDGVIDFHTNDSASAQDVARAIGATDLGLAIDITGGGNLAVTVVGQAVAAVQAGTCDVVVVFRSLNGRSGNRYGSGERPAVPMRGELQFAALNGYVVPPMWIAMFAQRHRHVYGTTDEDFGHIAINTRNHAIANPHATQRKPITMEDYLSSRWIAEPFRLYDCCLETDGAVALVITTAERAGHLRHAPVRIAGFGEAHTHGGSWTNFPDLSDMYSSYASARLWASTGLRPADLDLACMYDCFTGTVMATVEDFGLCAKGETGAYFAEGRATYGGDVVINPHGGLLSEGYLHGMNHHYEAVLQLRCDAGERQVPDARHALVTAGAGPAGGALIYEVLR
ncbi:lipid-transfer protein [Nocardioides sp. cx-169]|uniref:thiolase C-terminal domain-containing protein n=1 Tax=Nocardioides sp. cx-169 TaxID=2899080 RepID=UPI001E579F54|nr:lipid-transfer protein [Nocardioides sp. cx-169]MCD4533016.1 lipid-transfer protein [Nocardioides sp. cx-169]